MDAIPAVMTGDMNQARRFCRPFLEKLSMSICIIISEFFVCHHWRHQWMMSVKTVYEGYTKTVLLQQCSNAQKAKGLEPEIIRGKVEYPGIYKEQVTIISMHRKRPIGGRYVRPLTMFFNFLWCICNSPVSIDLSPSEILVPSGCAKICRCAFEDTLNLKRA